MLHHHALHSYPTRRSSDLMAINDDVAKLIDNLAEVRPTVLYAVPRIFNRIYDGVNKQMTEKPGAIRALFHKGLSAASRKAKDRKSTRLNSSHSQISYAVFC